MVDKAEIGIMGGSGLYDMEGLSDVREHHPADEVADRVDARQVRAVVVVDLDCRTVHLHAGLLEAEAEPVGAAARRGEHDVGRERAAVGERRGGEADRVGGMRRVAGSGEPGAGSQERSALGTWRSARTAVSPAAILACMIAAALTAAETGHLVLATLHTTGGPETRRGFSSTSLDV